MLLLRQSIHDGFMIFAQSHIMSIATLESQELIRFLPNPIEIKGKLGYRYWRLSNNIRKQSYLTSVDMAEFHIMTTVFLGGVVLMI